ncbi:zinc-dependent alcohol dehydrogenase [Zhaonella formicivorans]|uniref:zinc-dependent alcohol dehydrogenase n=1 Tax=Zhaonella formicivorans TaxID=2528593 RepID=UPI0010DB582C|nr:alcohol dehydrogenase catalytic domain-containing protein [Zhaonella formicivorans]
MTGTMKVGAIISPGKVKVVQVNKPKPGVGEVLVKVKACALCTWEQRVFSGAKQVPLPYLGGHEVVGEIAELGNGVHSRWKVGNKVAIRTLAHCGECYYCQQGEDNLCEQIGKLPRPVLEMDGIGGLSEYLIARPSQLFRLSPELDFTIGAFSEPLACVIHSIEKAHLKIGNDVVIVGAGIMGLLHLLLAKKLATRVIVCEVNAKRRQLAKELGADFVINSAEENAVEVVKSLTDGRGADAVIHTTAIAEVAAEAIEMAGKMGRVIMYGSFYPDKPISVSPNYIHNSQIVITGAVSPSTEDFLKATRLLNYGIINPAPFIQAVFPLADIQEAFQLASKPDTFRVIVSF